MLFNTSTERCGSSRARRPHAKRKRLAQTFGLLSLLLVQAANCYNGLTQHIPIGVTVDGSFEKRSGGMCYNGQLIEGSEFLCRFNEGDTGDSVRFNLGTAKNVGSIVFVINPLERNANGDVENFLLYVGASSNYSQSTACNGGQPVRNNGIINCVVQGARYIHIVAIKDEPDLEISEVLIFEQPDFASRHLESITTSGTVVSSDSLEEIIGLVSDTEKLGAVEVSFPAGVDEQERYVEIVLKKALPSVTVLAFQSGATSQDTKFILYRESDDKWSGVGSSTLQQDDFGTETGGNLASQFRFYQKNILQSSTTSLFMDIIGIFPQENSCLVSFQASFDSPTASFECNTDGSDCIFSVPTAASYSPSWCTFSSTNVYSFYEDEACLTAHSDPTVTLSFTNGSPDGQLTVSTTDTSLVGQTKVYYLTTDVDGQTYDLYSPIAISVQFTHPCYDTTIDQPAPIAEQHTPIGVSLSVTVQIPWNSQATAQSNFDFCGPKTLTLTDSSGSQPFFAVVNPQVGQAIDLVFTGTTSDIGRHTITIAFTLDNFTNVVASTATFDVVFCPTSIDTSSFQVVTPAAITQFEFDIDTQAYTSSQLTMSTYSYTQNEGCFEYVSFRVESLDNTETGTTSAYDDSIGVLSRSYVSYTQPMETFNYELYVTLGDPSIPASQAEFLLDSFTVRTVPDVCDTQPTAFSLSTSLYQFTQALDSVQELYTISAPNSVAQAYSDPDLCGPITNTYVVQGTTSSVSYAHVDEVAVEDFTFRVETPSADIGQETVVFMITSTLTNYPSVTTTIEVQVTFTCSTSYTPTIQLGTSVDFSTPLVYDLSAASPQSFSVTQTTIYREGCAQFDSPTVYDVTVPGSPVEETMIIYDPSTATISISVADPTALPSLHEESRSYKTKLSLADSNGPISGTNQEIDSFQVRFAFLTIDATVDCPSTTLMQSTFSGSKTITLPLDSPGITISYPDSEDTYGILYKQFDFCGDREHSFTDSLTSAQSTLMQITTSPTGQASIDVSPVEIGTWYVTQTTSLLSYSSIPSVTLDWTIVVTCPTQLSSLDPTTVTVVDTIPVTYFEYDVTSMQTLQADLATYEFDKVCSSVTKSYIVDSQSLSIVSHITLDQSINTMSIYTEDTTNVLVGTTVTYFHLIDLNDGQEGVQVASFQIQYLGQNYAPYFDPPLSAYLQVFKQEDAEEWSYTLPPFFDVNVNDAVTLTVNTTAVDAFMSYNQKSKKLTIADLADPSLPTGSFKIFVTLSDGKASQVQSVTVNILENLVASEIEDDEPDSSDDIADDSADEQPAENSETEDEVDDEQNQQGETTSETDTFVFDWRAAFLKKEKEMRQSGAFFKMQPPRPYLSFIRETGEVKISFNQKMQILPDLDMIKEGKLVIEGQTFKVFDIKVIPGEGQDPRNTVFDWQVTEMNESSMKIKLIFKQAVYVSAQFEPDVLEIIFRDRYLFVGLNNLAISTKPLTQPKLRLLSQQEEEQDFIFLRKQIPQQLPLGGVDEQIAEVMTQASSASQLALASNFVLNIFLAASLNHLWSMINTQQLIVMMPLFRIQLPANAANLFRLIMEIAAFDFVDTGDTIHALFNVEETDPIDVNFASIGFESMYFLTNMGTLVVFFIVYLALNLVLPILACCGKKSEYCQEKAKSMRPTLYWNYLITLMKESYMIVIVCIFINIQIFSFETAGLTSMTVLCCLFLFMFIILPIIFIGRLYNNFKIIDSKAWKSRYGELYDGLYLKNGPSVLLVPSFFLFRRVMLGVAVCIVGKILIWQIFLMAAQIIIQVIIIGSGVFPTRSKRMTEYFNELILMQVMYTILCFTPWVDDVPVRFQIGYLTCFWVGLHLVVNLFIIFRVSIRESIMKCKIKAQKRKLKAQRKLLKTQLKDTREKRRELRQQKRKEAEKKDLAWINAEKNRKPAVPVSDENEARKEGSPVQVEASQNELLGQTKKVTFQVDVAMVINVTKHIEEDKFADVEKHFDEDQPAEAQKHTTLLKKKQLSLNYREIKREATQLLQQKDHPPMPQALQQKPLASMSGNLRTMKSNQVASRNEPGLARPQDSSLAISWKRKEFTELLQRTEAMIEATNQPVEQVVAKLHTGKTQFIKEESKEQESLYYNESGYVPAKTNFHGTMQSTTPQAEIMPKKQRDIRPNFDNFYHLI